MDYNPLVLQEQISTNSDKNQNKVRVAILQIEDRYDPYFEWCINLNKEYCKKHDIDHILLRQGPSDLPPYWHKVSVFLDLMNMGKHDIICWMDSDAFVYHTAFDIRNFFEKFQETMIVAPDPDGWGSPFMAAVYMCRNNAKGRQIFEEWISLYNPSKWRKDDSGKMKYIGRGPWAGIDYEQGAFAKIILPKHKANIRSLPWYVLHETNCKEPHSLTWSIHLPGAIRQVRPNCVVNEQSRRRMRTMDISLIIILILIIIVLLLIGIYIIILKGKI